MNEIDQLIDVADRFLADRSPISRVVDGLMGRTEPGIDRDLWQEEAALGWTGLIIPEKHGGSELGYLAQGKMLESFAQFLVPEPFLSSVCLATPLLLVAGDKGDAFLAGIADGSAVVSVALPDDKYFPSGDSPVAALQQSDGGWKFSGNIPFVLDYPDADWVLVPAKTDEGLAWFALRTSSEIGTEGGLVMDGRRASNLNFDGFSAEADSLLIAPQIGDRGYKPVVTVSAALLSAWMLGFSEHAFAFTLEHLRTRVQYGAPIGSYQALQHRMADLYCDIQVARSVVDAALRSLDDQSDEMELLTSAAKARAGALAMNVTGEAIQMHGGMGMTEEAGIGLYYKAAKVANWLGGSQIFYLGKAAALRGVVRSF